MKNTAISTYETFLRSKAVATKEGGFAVKRAELHPSLFEFQKDMILWALRRGRTLIAASFGMGKCHGAGTKILMADGTIKNVEDVQVGDQLMGDDGTPRNVLSLARGRERMYRITLKNGDNFACNESHVLSLYVSNKFKEYRQGDVVNMPLSEWLMLPDYAKRNCFKHYKVAIDFPEQEIPFNAYLYGAWLGDGHCGNLTWTINDRDTEITEQIQEFAAGEDLLVKEIEGRGCTSYRLIRQVRGRAPHCDAFYFVKDSSDDEGKHIDHRYLRNNRSIRLQLLAGLLDTDGYLTNKCYEIATKWEGLRDDILYLCRSLGFSVSHAPKIVNGVTYHRIWISGNTHLIPCATRKKAEPRQQIKNPLVYGFQADLLGMGDYYGFEIDGNHLYLLGDFTVTHNTVQQIEILRQIHLRTSKPVMVICPLGVKHQFIVEDGPRLGVQFVYVRTDKEAAQADTPYLITNYERVRDGNITATTLLTSGGISLDEGAILGNLGTKTQNEFNILLSEIPYRFVATATPAPNDYRQMIYFADFLDAMDAGQALTRFFGRNPDKAGDLQLMPHMERDFWLWVAQWTLFVGKPSDLGYADDGYIMPELDMHWHRIAADHERAFELTNQEGQRYLLKDTAAGVQQAMREKRDSLHDRIAQAFAIVEGVGAEQLVIWCNLNDEQSAIERGLKQRGITYSSVHGSLSPEAQEERLYEWKRGETQALISKAQMLGSGVNLQQCHIAIYVGVDFKFRDYIQSIHRLQRYGQTQTVQIHCIHTDAEDHVVDILTGKWTQHDEMVERMRGIIKEYGLTNEALVSEMRRSLGVTRQERKGQFWTAINNDTVLETMTMADESIDEIVTSIPFGNHYEYVASLNDFGHNPSDDDFWQQMDFLIPELLRVLKPGRMACIHAKDRLLYGHQTPHGMMEVDYFTHECARAFRKHGFVAYGEIFIPTDVVRENSSTNRLGWTENCKDGSKMGVGLSEKVLLFRKLQTDKTRSYADEPVRKDKKEYSRGRWQVDAHSLWRSDGKALETPADNPELLQGMDGSQIYNWYRDWSKDAPYDYHQHVAFNEAVGPRLPATFMLMPPQAPSEYEETVWTDILFMRTLNMSQARRRVEKHLCLAAGSSVLTRRGYVPIQDVLIGDMVLTHKGRWRPVIAKQNTGVRPVVKLIAQGVPGLLLTPDHKVWARKGNRVRQREGAEYVAPEWIQAQEMAGGYVNLQLPPEEPALLDRRELWLLGRWLADGHVGTRGDFWVSIGEEKLAEFERMAGDYAGTRSHHTAVQIRLKGLSDELREALAVCGRGAAGKQLPPFAPTLSQEDARALLEGYLSGDGHYLGIKHRWMASSVSKQLLLGIAMLAQRVHGAIASVYAGRPGGEDVIEGRKVKTRQDWLLCFDLPKERRTKPFVLDDGAWKRVKSVTSMGEMETWNLRVEEDESYTVEGCIVKNCPLPLDIVERLIVRYSNPNDLILDPFAGLGTVPYVAIKLGRRSIGTELNPVYFDAFAHYCQDAESQRQAPTLFDVSNLDAQWPDMPDLQDGVDRFAEHEITGEPIP